MSEPSLGKNALETGWRSWLSIPRDAFNHPLLTVLLIFIAWAFCALVRSDWIAWAQDIPQFNWVGGVQPTTHDSYTHGAVLQQHLEGRHAENLHLYPILNKQGALHLLTWALLNVVPISIPKVLLWGPVFLGSMIVIPVVLMGRLFGSSLWGFTAALLTGIAWNYYERSMAGYFDTDLFSFSVALLLMYFLLAAHQKKSLLYAGLGAVTVFLYPFFYAKGLVIGAGVAACFVGLQVLCLFLRMDVEKRLRMIALVGVGAAMSPWSNGSRMYLMPWMWFIGVAAVVVAWVLLSRVSMSRRGVGAVLGVGVLCLAFMMPWGYFAGQIQTYSRVLGVKGADVSTQLDPVAMERAEIRDEINFRKTHKHTVLESQPEAPAQLARRMTGSVTGTLLAIVGYLLMCIRYPGFLIALPFAFIGIFSLDGGLRFTTWGGIIASPALVYMLFIIVQAVFRCLPAMDTRVLRFGTVAGSMLLSAPFIAVNVAHAFSFKITTVFQLDAIDAMQAIKRDSSPGDYVLSWWDYGSGLWYYSERNVLMTPISASDDCWTIAQIMTSDSPKVAAGLARLAAEASAQGHKPASHHILGLDGDSPIRPEKLIADLKAGRVDLPEPTRDVYLYMPWEMLKLLSVIEAYADPEYTLPTDPKAGVFHALDETLLRNPTPDELLIPPGITVRLNNLKTLIRGEEGNLPVQFKSVTYVREFKDGRTAVKTAPPPTRAIPKVWVRGGKFDYKIKPAEEPIPENHYWPHLIILESSRTALIVDDDFMNSNYVQMVAIQKFDHDLWELVYKTGYARVFRLNDRARTEKAAGTSETEPVTIDDGS